MAIYTGMSRIASAKKKSAKAIAKQQRAAQKKEGKRGFWSGLFGKGLGAVGGSALAGALGIASGGLLMPLIMGASESLAKKWTGDVSKKLSKAGDIQATGPYGYGKEAASEARKDIAESRKSTWSPETLAQDIALSYVSAGAKGELGAAKQVLKGDVTGKEALLGTKDWKFGGLKGAKAGVGELFGTAWGEDGDEAEMMPTSQAELPLTSEEIAQSQISGGEMGSLAPEQLTTTGEYGDIIGEEGWSEYEYAQGGLIPNKAPSIVDYFSMQGKTLGGSNTQSLSQMLGRS